MRPSLWKKEKWSDRNKTTSYELYQYLINVDDELVIDYLKIFTFLSKEEIEALDEENKNHPEMRNAHKILAREIITDLHGKEAYEEAVEISESLFKGDIKKLNANEIETAFKGLTPYQITEEKNIVDLLTEANICKSKREAREFITNGSITLNGEKIENIDFLVNKNVAIEQKYVVIRRGKKKYYIIKF